MLLILLMFYQRPNFLITKEAASDLFGVVCRIFWTEDKWMKIHKILLETLTPKNSIKVKIENSELHISAEETMLSKSCHHVNVPSK